MLIDFCHHSVRPRIKCDKVTFDGYEVTNLISEDARLKSMGFISDHFVKPPVNVTVQFPCNISIYRVVVDPVISQQQSCDIKLFTASCAGLDPWLTGNNGSKEKDLKTDGLLFNFIGSSMQAAPVLTCYQNNSFRDRGIWNRDSFESVSSFPASFELKGRKPSCLFNVSHLSVNVLRSRGGKSVAIKRLEVWGMPSRNVPDSAQIVLRLAFQRGTGVGSLATHNEKMKENKKVTNSTAQGTDKPQTNSVSENVLHGDVEVPDDFLDQITFEIMAVPILLPCGKNVDQSTLDKFANTEASWGRHPSDPFTGVPLQGQGHQAIPNPALKARIDQFVLQHSESLNVPRTLGKGDQNTSDRFASSKITGVPPKRCVDMPELPGDSQPKSQQIYKYMNMPLKRKSTHLISNDMTEQKKICMRQPTYQMKSWRALPKAIVQTPRMQPMLQSEKDLTLSKGISLDLSEYTKHSQPVYTSRLDHSKSLSSSLDTALLNTLTALPSFTRTLKHAEDKGRNSPVKDGACCKCAKDSESVLYKLPCQHIMCRACVQKTTGLIDCNKCCRQFKNRDIVRVFKT